MGEIVKVYQMPRIDGYLYQEGDKLQLFGHKEYFVPETKHIKEAIKLLEEKGYSVTKKKPMPKTSRCICGKWPSEWYGANGYIRRCSHCGFKGTFGKTRRKSIENWNKTIREVENKCLIECGTDPCPSYPCEKFKEK